MLTLPGARNIRILDCIRPELNLTLIFCSHSFFSDNSAYSCADTLPLASISQNLPFLCCERRSERKPQILVLFVCLILIAVSVTTDAGEKLLADEKLPLPDDAKITSPGAEVSEQIAAFSGIWEGKESNLEVRVFLIAEEINTKEAKVIFCRAAYRNYPAKCFRYKAIVTPEKQQIEFGPNKRYWSTYHMENNLNHPKGTIKNPGFSYKATMTKLKPHLILFF